MSEEKIRSGSFLSDVEIKILIRSGQTDVSELKKLIQAVKASVTSLVDTNIVLTEIDEKVNITGNRKLSIVSYSLYIK